jgi:hypothetical protein
MLCVETIFSVGQWFAYRICFVPVNNNDLLYFWFLNDSKKWDVHRILSMFDQHLVARILTTPLYSSVTDDRRIWYGESKEEYFVKSAYIICVQGLIYRMLLLTYVLVVIGIWCVEC